MRNNIVSTYKNNTIFGSVLMIGIMILLIGFSYAFFVYNKTGLYTHTITGGRLSILYNETTGNNITIDNAYPLTDEEALTKGLEFEFTITGYNESDKNIYYAIEMDYGEDVENKERFLDNNLKLSLYENDEAVFENEIFDNLDNQDIHYGMINYGISSESPVTNNYKLRIWINDYVIISDTISNDLSTWTDFEWDFLENYNKNVYDLLMNSDSQDLSDYGISIYTTEEFQNRYANFKVNVKADLTYDDVGFITYDANGGEFTPEKTSLTTGRVTTQKPVMIAESSQTRNNLNGRITQIENENNYVYKGFLGWSSTPNGEVEYKAGDYYSGEGKMLYAVYGDTVNKMVEYWPTELNEMKENINYIRFINDTQINIDNNYNNAEYKWDLSYDESSNVKSWIGEVIIEEYGESYNLTCLYIGSEGTIYLTNGYGLFTDWYSLLDISFDNVDTSMVTDMSYMFSSESADDFISPISSIKKETILPIVQAAPHLNYIEYLDLSSFNTSSVVNMSHMFDSNGFETELIEINLDNFDTSNVIDMSYMFSGCEVFELNLDNFDTSKVKTMQGIFMDSRLYVLNLNSFNTSNVEDMSYMFSHCWNLEKLDIVSFDTIKVKDMSHMFNYCSSLVSLDLSGFDTGKVKNMASMFNSCSSLVSLDLSSFDTSNVIDMSYMFARCSLIGSFDLRNFNTSNVTNMQEMFSGCSSLETIYCNNDWNIGTVTSHNYMFYNCTSLVGAVSYNSSKIDITMANPTTGYFTYKEI